MRVGYKSRDRLTDVCCYADIYANDGRQLVLVSFGGPEQAVQAVVSAILSRRDGVYVLNGTAWYPGLEESYRAFVSRNGDVVHAIVLSGAATGAFGPSLVMGWDGLDRALEGVLRRDYGVPFLPEWVPYIREVMERYDLLRPIRVVGDTPLVISRLSESVTAETLLEIIRRGLDKGKLVIPATPSAEDIFVDWRDVSGVAEYLARFAPVLGCKVEAMVQPRRRAGSQEFSPEIGRLLRRPYQAQADVIEGCAAHLRERRSVLVVGTMGTGKTLIGAAIPYVVERGRPYRALVMCPGHLVEKWAREVRTTVPEAKVLILKTFADLARLDPWAKPEVPEYHVISRDRAKLSYLRRPAVEWKRGLVAETDEGKKMVRVPGWHCPDCGVVQADPETGMPLGERAFARPTQANARCQHCGTPLWTANRKIHRYAPADFIKKHLRGYYQYLVADEAHELKGETAQGEAFGALAGACGRTIALTGTLLGGYATNLFRIMFRLNPEAVLREGIGYRAQMSWASRYGVLERVYRKKDADRRKTTRGGFELVRVTEKPGVSPVVFPNHLLGSCAFLDLEDLGLDLPPYNERVEVLGMLPEQAGAYSKVKTALREVVTGFGSGGKRLLATYLQVLLSYPDRPWGFEPVIHPVTGDVVVVPDDLDQDLLYPKEERLVQLVREAKARGRRVFVYVTYTGTRDVAGRLAGVLEKAGIGTAVLRAGLPEPAGREKWIQDRIKEGAWCVVANADLVKTGLDLYEFPELVFYQTGYSIYTLRQASRRSWRIGQTRPVRVTFLSYQDTMQEAALRLIGSKLRASLAIEGKFSGEGLLAMCEGEDLTLALAKVLIEGMAGLETAESIWRDMAARAGWSEGEEVPPLVTVGIDALVSLPPRVLEVGKDLSVPKCGKPVGVGQLALDLGV